jgi:hypothetical protein
MGDQRKRLRREGLRRELAFAAGGIYHHQGRKPGKVVNNSRSFAATIWRNGTCGDNAVVKNSRFCSCHLPVPRHTFVQGKRGPRPLFGSIAIWQKTG